MYIERECFAGKSNNINKNIHKKGSALSRRGGSGVRLPDWAGSFLFPIRQSSLPLQRPH